jgi:hypothetical protein
VNGVAVIDASNPCVDVGRSTNRSVLDVPALPSRFDERLYVPHGTLHIREYVFDVVKLCAFVYVPPQYDIKPQEDSRLNRSEGEGTCMLRG